MFYIGKGMGNRVFQHAEQAVAASDEELASQKISLIRDIHSEGLEVEAFIIRHGIRSSRDAYEVEAAVLDVLRLIDGTGDNEFFALTNLMGGHHASTRGLAGVDVVTSLYDAPPSPDITEPSLLIKIPGLWTPTMTPDELYHATRFWWKTSLRREKARYVFSINHGVIRQVYEIEAWRKWTLEEADKPGDRWGFDGHVAPEMAHYLNSSVKHLYKRGDANPVRYMNC